jgi:Transglycosylase SLT domain/Peptidase family M23
MTSRKLLIAITAAVLYAAVLVATASAQEHRVQVTLVTGQVMTLTVDVPPGGSVASALPALPAPVKSVIDLGPIATPTPVPTVPVPTPTVPSVPTVPSPSGTATPSPSPSHRSGGNGGTANGGSSDGTQGTPTPAAGGGTNSGSSRTRARGVGNRSSGSGSVGSVRCKAHRLTRKVRKRVKANRHALTRPNGTPTLNNPTVSLVSPGPAAIGVPNFFIDKFRIPPFLLPIYQAAGIQYGVRWEVLAAINEIETDYGRNLNVSSAGAVGWMQFMPSTWRMYGVDANGDGIRDPYNPADAIFAAARYLRAAGATNDLRRAIFAYNHAGWYVDSVLLRARLIAGLPSNLVGSLTGLTQGRFPVDARARYADELSRADLKHRRRVGNAANVIESGMHRSIDIFARRDAPVVAVNDGRIVKVGESRRLGRFIVLQDVYGNTYTYGHLGRVAKRYPAPRPHRVTQKEITKELQLPRPDAAPTTPASDTTRPAAHAPSRHTARRATPKGRTHRRARVAPTKQRLFAHPNRPRSAAAGGAQQEFERTGRLDGDPTVAGYLKRVFGLDRKDVRLRPLRKGAHVVAGTLIGRVGKTVPGKAPHLYFEIRPAGRGAPRIDPKPILDGWKLLESTAIYRAAGQNPFVGDDAPSIGQILLMGKDELAQRVLADPRIQIYECGRRDIQTGQIDRRVLATLEFLAASGFKPTVTALKCGHSLMTVSGNISEHSTGDAVDIAAVNGIPILGHQGPGSITELVIQRLLTLQGTMKPHQIISLMTFPGTDNTLAMPDHANHIHVGFRPMYGANSKLARQVNAILRPQQWTRLIDRLGQLDEPVVPRMPSRFATKVKPTPQGQPGD